jgi:Fe-S-cluster-containing hydrogenase component 2
MQACLFFSDEEDAYSNEEYLRGRVISKQEALELVESSEKEGLVHCTYNIEDGQIFICNCCSCACVGLRSLKEFNAPYMLAKSNFAASIDLETCEACGVCADERCPMDAIVEQDDGYSVLAERCIGCGVCVSTCPSESIALQRKSDSEHDTPPANLLDWRMKRAAARGIEINVD